MQANLRLLGWVNKANGPESTVPVRYLAAITAGDLSGLLTYDRVGKRKNDRFRLREDSFIQIDKEIQRGRDSAGALLQIPSKVEDIATTLLGSSSSLPHAFLGTLIWNVRPGDSEVRAIKQESLSGGMPEFSLSIKADHVWLTDSAHRHLGIAEAYRRAKANPSKFPRFSASSEFVVEVYQLDRAGEKALFFELNALQRRISAAKRVELDLASPAGYLKDAIRSYDEQNGRLLTDNIEVTANQNRSHTLMTMSVFVSSIQQMFPKQELDETHKSAVKRDELAEFYCDFFYKLRDTLVISVDDPATGQPLQLSPFYNLYTSHIQPVLEDNESPDPAVLDAALESARKKANELNKLVRSVDVANHNSTVRALARLAAKLRFMPKWDRVIDYLQVGLNLPMDGRFFQLRNAELTATPADPRDVQIANVNEDGTINLQVQSQTINALYKYLRRKLHLALAPSLSLVSETADDERIPLRGTEPPSVAVSRRDGGSFSLELEFYVGAEVEVDELQLKLALEPKDVEWKDMKLTGARRLEPQKVERDEGYEHPQYGSNIQRWIACYNVKVPGAFKKAPSQIVLEARMAAPDLDLYFSEEIKGEIQLLLE